MSAVVVDTSILIKWFHAEGEDEVAESRAVLEAHREEVITAHILDLTIYELGNILVRALRWQADDVADQLDDVLMLCGPGLVLAPPWRRDAASLAVEHRLSFYDAAFAAAARALDAPLLSADHKLIAAGLAEPVMDFTRRAGLV